MFQFRVLVLLFLAEVLLISWSFDAATASFRSHSDSLQTLLSSAGDLAKILVAMGAAFAIALYPRRAKIIKDFAQAVQAIDVMAAHRSRAVCLVFHLFLFFLFFVTTDLLFSVPNGLTVTQQKVAFFSWVSIMLCLVVTWAGAVNSFKFWRDLLLTEQRSAWAALLAGLVAFVFAALSQNLWQPLAENALYLSQGMLNLWFDDVIVNYQLHLLGVDSFIVEVGQPCSGYEGIGLISVFTSLYIYLNRQKLRLARSLWLFPIGIILIWLFNVLRIVGLVSLGATTSPAIAEGGFHSQAGWISFIVVSMTILVTADRWAYLRQPSSHQNQYIPKRETSKLGRAAATLLPLVVLLAVGIITNSVSATINWLYPIKTLAGLGVLIYVWQELKMPAFDNPKSILIASLVGVGLAILWLVFSESTPDTELRLKQTFAAIPTFAVWVWVSIRILGAALIVPIAEELAFRGYLLCKLARTEINLEQPLTRSWAALVISSVLFGVLHDAWLLGTIAGISYALVRYHSTSIWPPIFAHGVTNLVIGVYAVMFDNWSLLV